MVVLTMEKKGWGNGLPKKAVIRVQSKVIGMIPNPVWFPKDLVHNHIRRSNPADPIEIRQTLRDPAGGTSTRRNYRQRHRGNTGSGRLTTHWSR